jgi:hypothetical protein
MEREGDTGYMVFGWPSEEPAGGMRDFLGVVEDLECPWKLARITDTTEIVANGDWCWTVDVIEVYRQKSFEPSGSWWVDSNGDWRVFTGTYG